MNKRKTIKNLLELSYFSFDLVLHGFYPETGAFKGHNGKTMSILANGPSLKGVLEKIETEEFIDTEFFVMNFMGLESVFKHIKPKYYALADPMFIKKDVRYEKVMSLFDTLNNDVDWEMHLFVPFKKSAFLAYSKLTNPHIQIHYVRAKTYSGFSWMRNLFYKKGWAVPLFSSVVILCIYTSINYGFDTIRLYGVDHSMICNLKVDNENHLCNVVEHFYSDKNENTLKPLKHVDTGKYYKVSEMMLECYGLFRSHEFLSEYAKKLDTKIINCTDCSMIDSYTRKIML